MPGAGMIRMIRMDGGMSEVGGRKVKTDVRGRRSDVGGKRQMSEVGRRMMPGAGMIRMISMDDGRPIEPGSYLFLRICRLIVSVSKIYGSTDSHYGHGSHDNNEACHGLILLFGGDEDSENKHQDGHKGSNHNHARRDDLVRKEHRSAQKVRGQTSDDRGRRSVGRLATFSRL
jgi:hypothetical protein